MAYPNKAKTTGPTHEQIIRDVRAGHIAPIYYLMGAESYYIDRLADFLVGSLLKPEERDFNLVTLFGADTKINEVILAAKAFPMGAPYTVVVVKEAQNLDHIEQLEFYCKQPQPSTVLIICHKNGTLDRRQKVASAIEKVGVLYESKKLSDGQLPTFVHNYVARQHKTIDNNAAAMMGEFVGADLNRLASELDKLLLSLPEGETQISEALVRAHVGVTKEFGIFELQDALAEKDIQRANQIADYFDKNPKAYPVQKFLPVLFKFFSNLMMAYYAPDKSERGVAQWLGISDWQARRSIIPAMQRYTGVKVMNIIEAIRRTDARSKGVGNSDISSGDLMRELLFFILH